MKERSKRRERVPEANVPRMGDETMGGSLGENIKERSKRRKI